MKKIHLMLVVSLLLLFILVGCSNTQQTQDTSGKAESTEISLSAEEALDNKSSIVSEEKTLYAASQYAPASLDTHKGYSGWHTSTYGISETLFKVGDDFSLEPLLAKSGTVDGLAWTIVLKDNVSFSNGDLLTADMVVRNLERVAV